MIEGIKKTKYTLSRSDRMLTIAAALYDMPTQTISEDLAREKAREVAAHLRAPEEHGIMLLGTVKGLQRFLCQGTLWYTG